MLAEAGRSAVTQAAVIAATKSIEVGTYVANAFARSPWLTGLTARDLDEMSEAVSLGVEPNFTNDWYMYRLIQGAHCHARLCRNSAPSNCRASWVASELRRTRIR